uniref:RIMS binding protein 2 n=1 Tax=Ursus americanus TaxID=9643 RepID=A0A452R1Y6_URSAM
MREAAERRQQLELEHEQALAVLHAKQQEIDLLQKWVLSSSHFRIWRILQQLMIAFIRTLGFKGQKTAKGNLSGAHN